jgi:hypothetical protein
MHPTEGTGNRDYRGTHEPCGGPKRILEPSQTTRDLKGANYGSHWTLFDYVVSERQQIG